MAKVSVLLSKGQKQIAYEVDTSCLSENRSKRRSNILGVTMGYSKARRPGGGLIQHFRSGGLVDLTTVNMAAGERLQTFCCRGNIMKYSSSLSLAL